MRSTLLELGVLFIGLFSAYMIGTLITTNEHTVECAKRAVQLEKAYYHPQTGVITWSDNITKFIVTGEQ